MRDKTLPLVRIFMNNAVSESHEYSGWPAGLSSSVEERKKASELRKKR
jgi:hypothetical protein